MPEEDSEDSYLSAKFQISAYLFCWALLRLYQRGLRASPDLSQAAAPEDPAEEAEQPEDHQELDEAQDVTEEYFDSQSWCSDGADSAGDHVDVSSPERFSGLRKHDSCRSSGFHQDEDEGREEEPLVGDSAAVTLDSGSGVVDCSCPEEPQADVSDSTSKDSTGSQTELRGDISHLDVESGDHSPKSCSGLRKHHDFSQSTSQTVLDVLQTETHEEQVMVPPVGYCDSEVLDPGGVKVLNCSSGEEAGPFSTSRSEMIPNNLTDLVLTSSKDQNEAGPPLDSSTDHVNFPSTECSSDLRTLRPSCSEGEHATADGLQLTMDEDLLMVAPTCDSGSMVLEDSGLVEHCSPDEDADIPDTSSDEETELLLDSTSHHVETSKRLLDLRKLEPSRTEGQLTDDPLQTDEDRCQLTVSQLCDSSAVILDDLGCEEAKNPTLEEPSMSQAGVPDTTSRTSPAPPDRSEAELQLDHHPDLEGSDRDHESITSSSEGRHEVVDRLQMKTDGEPDTVLLSFNSSATVVDDSGCEEVLSSSHPQEAGFPLLLKTCSSDTSSLLKGSNNAPTDEGDAVPESELGAPSRDVSHSSHECSPGHKTLDSSPPQFHQTVPDSLQMNMDDGQVMRKLLIHPSLRLTYQTFSSAALLS
ncbi:uncharacterized protein LOC134302264 [Trichomycterus rosablanca]|uniref:uncharacterized protein LOC134302264 n=1 Tax=Trichomycterus rosablanca TaxID=2290929 RepID=UPI002F35A5DB